MLVELGELILQASFGKLPEKITTKGEVAFRKEELLTFLYSELIHNV
jgi:hypothetical protein